MNTFRSLFLFSIAALIGASLHVNAVTTSAFADDYGSSSSSWSSVSSFESSMMSSESSMTSTSSSFMSSQSSATSSEISSSTSMSSSVSSDVSSQVSSDISSPSSNTSCNLYTACVVNGLADKLPGADLSGPKDPATDWEAMRRKFANQGDLGLSVLYYNVSCPAGCTRGAMINDPCEPNARKYDVARADLSEYDQPTTQAYGCRAQ